MQIKFVQHYINYTGASLRSHGIVGVHIFGTRFKSYTQYMHVYVRGIPMHVVSMNIYGTQRVKHNIPVVNNISVMQSSKLT